MVAIVEKQPTVAEAVDHHNRINRLEAEIVKLPPPNIQITHHFAPGIYAREMRVIVEPGTEVAITGKIHNEKHLNIVSMGRLTVYNERGELREIKAGECFVSEPGTRRAAIVHETTVWTTIHTNPTEERDIAVIENRLVHSADNPLLTNTTQPCLSSQ